MSQNQSPDRKHLTPVEVGQLARRLFGPEEEWTDDEADFVLRLYGTIPDTEDEDQYALRILKKVIQRFRDEHKEVPPSLLKLLGKFEKKTLESVNK